MRQMIGSSRSASNPETYLGVTAASSITAPAAFADALVADERVQPAGLGARDSLRLEAGLPLYGQDLGEDITPHEAGLLWAIKQTEAENIYVTHGYTEIYSKWLNHKGLHSEVLTTEYEGEILAES